MRYPCGWYIVGEERWRPHPSCCGKLEKLSRMEALTLFLRSPVQRPVPVGMVTRPALPVHGNPWLLESTVNRAGVAPAQQQCYAHQHAALPVCHFQPHQYHTSASTNSTSIVIMRRVVFQYAFIVQGHSTFFRPPTASCLLRRCRRRTEIYKIRVGSTAPDPHIVPYWRRHAPSLGSKDRHRAGVEAHQGHGDDILFQAPLRS